MLAYTISRACYRLGRKLRRFNVDPYTGRSRAGEPTPKFIASALPLDQGSEMCLMKRVWLFEYITSQKSQDNGLSICPKKNHSKKKLDTVRIEIASLTGVLYLICYRLRRVCSLSRSMDRYIGRLRTAALPCRLRRASYHWTKRPICVPLMEGS